ncbi:hypothetical protein BH11BAC2_BH11BAC2_00950 [soil metagenome]
MNFPVILIAALVPMIMGFIWYNPKVFGNIWMRESGLTLESMKGANMAKTLILTFIFSFLIAVMLQMLVIHQFHLQSIVMGDPDLKNPDSELSIMMKNFIDKYGRNYRTFKHGAFHGTFAGIALILPIIATNAIYERRSVKYIFVVSGFWIISFALMGGILCQWA